MPRRRNDDNSPYINKVIQVCLDEPLLDKLNGVADIEYNGKVSVAARAIIRTALADVA
ncbi:MAG: hypothetical protein VXX91_07800 [Planctomycetota bacterium]|nr:hypothetical protein [Planctomycetota bacterium]